MSADLEQMVSELTAAVTLIMDPNVSQTERQRATQFCEEWKETSPLCLQCGMILSGCEYTPIMRRFGLQLIEHCIKFCWNSMSVGEKNNLKLNSLQLIQKGTKSILEEESYVKDAISRIVVEIIKREWPQNWPSLFDDLHKLSMEGPAPTELILKVFLRLAEDVVEFQSIPAQRRREVQQTLTSQMANIIQFFLRILGNHLDDYLQKTASSTVEDTQAAKSACTVVCSVLETLCAYVGWINMNLIVEGEPCLLQHLCLLLSDHNIQLQAAECLLLIVSRKGKVEERKPLLMLFNEDAMKKILKAAVDAELSPENEHSYLFLKRLCQVLTEIGKQICCLWDVGGVDHPQCFHLYLESLLAFTGHPSQILSNNVQGLWSSFFRHEQISKDPILLAFLPEVVKSTNKTLLKVGFPSQNNSPSCAYSRLDFDSDEDFNMFYSKYRCEVAEVLRSAAALSPKVTFDIASERLLGQLQKPVDNGEGACNHTSPLYLEWESLPVYLESIMSRLMQSPNPKPDMMEGVQLLEAVLSYEVTDPLILSCLLSCLSALSLFLPAEPKNLPILLKKIFSAVVFNMRGQTKSTRSKAVRNVRQHACSSLVKLCKQYPTVVFPVFEDLNNHIKEISQDPDQLSQMEKCILTEALLLISNQFNNFRKQSEFIGQVLAPVKALWDSKEFSEAFSSPAKFMSYIGLDQPAVEPSSADTCGINRSHITYCIHTMLPVMKRSQWPQELELQEKGGFITILPSGMHVLRNPATAHLTQLMDNLMALVKTLSGLWTPGALCLRHPDFTKAYDLVDSDKLQILGKNPPCTDNNDSATSKQPLERMQNFLAGIHDNSFHILGNAGQCLGYEFYTAPSLVAFLMDSVFNYMDHLPDYRLRPIIRVFMKPYIQHCPRDCYKFAVIPLLEVLCPFMHQRLSAKWLQIDQRSLNSDDAEEDDTQEVLDDQLTRQLTRDYIEMLGSVFVNPPKQEAEAVDDAMDEDIFTSPQQSNQEKLNELGVLCLHERISSCVETVFSCLYWSDTIASSKSSRFCWLIIKQLLVDEMLTGDTAAHLFTCVLRGLNVHGQHEYLQSLFLNLALQMYESLRPLYPQVVDILMQIPHMTLANIGSFDEKLTQKQVNERKKREHFKILVAEIIGKNVGQQFQREIKFKNLPPMVFPMRRKNLRLDETEATSLGLPSLFGPDGEDT